MNTNILFPSKFRFVAFAIISIVILSAVIAKMFNWNTDNESLKVFLFYTSNGLMCLALFLIQFSKYPEDDEMLMEIRLKLVLNALLVAVIYLIMSPFIEYFIFKDEIQEIPAGQILMFMLLYQIFMFQIKRFSLKKELEKES